MIAKQAISSTLDEWDIAGFLGADLLSESVRMLFNLLTFMLLNLFMLSIGSHVCYV
jgi:hypothetical protein